MSNEIEQITTKMAELGQKIEKDVATKAEVKKFADAFDAMQKELANDKSHNEMAGKIFTKAQAHDFLGCLGSLLEKTHFDFSKAEADRNGLTIATKADLNQSAGNGANFVPTSVDGTLSMLLQQNSVARREATVYNNLRGDYQIVKRNGTSTAAFTAAQNTAVVPNSLSETKVTLSPKQMCAISKVSEQLLWNSAVNVAEATAIDLAEQAGILEDNSVIRGTGAAAFGTIVGINDAASGVSQLAIANAAAFSIDALITLKYTTVHESARAKGKYYMSGAIFGTMAQLKASTAGSYHYDVTSQTLRLAGSEIVIWDRMDAALTAGLKPVYFGDFSKAVAVGTGRGLAITLSEQRFWDSNEVGFKLVQDFHAVLVQPTAIARINVTA